MKSNFKFTLSYDGSRYFGWEHQPNTELTIQGKLERVLSGITGMPEGDVKVIGAGRTDAGVHARAMVANAFLDTELREDALLNEMNRFLPDDISINEVKICSPRFHARYNAIGKTYRYSCYFGTRKPVFERKYLSILSGRPDVDAMKRAAEFLVGEHDFRSFCGNTHFKKSTIRKIDHLEITEKTCHIRMYFHGNGFLQNQVRIMVGTLLDVGFGKLAAEDIPEILEARDRGRAGHTAEARGLCLMKVDYE